MRFIDPLITLWHMGGGTPIHIGMAIYSYAVFSDVNPKVIFLEQRTKCLAEHFEKMDIETDNEDVTELYKKI